MRAYTIAILLLIISFSISVVGCVERNNIPEKVPAFKVTFLHYYINGTHVIKIKSIEKVEVNPSEIKMFGQPPFPGIHIFSIYSRGISDVASVPIKMEGDDISVYFTYAPGKLPEKGERVTLIVEVRDSSGRTLSRDMATVLW